MQRHCQGLDCTGAQPNAFRAVECYQSNSPTRSNWAASSVLISSSNVTRPPPFRTEEEPLRPAENAKAVLKVGVEIVECLIRFQRLVRYRSKDANKVARSVLEFP